MTVEQERDFKKFEKQVIKDFKKIFDLQHKAIMRGERTNETFEGLTRFIRVSS
jgi:hypothetical protein